jgi:hypothetical protein
MMTNTIKTGTVSADPCLTICRQLGGPAIFAMAFKDCGYSTDADGNYQTTLRIAPALVRGVPGKGTHVRVTLKPDDTYTVELIRVFKIDRRTFDIPEPVTVDKRIGVYADVLRTTVETMTGLRLTLGTMGGAQ